MDIINEFKIELVMYVNSDKLPAVKDINDAMFSKINEYEKKYLLNNPLWKSMNEKFHAADMGDYIKKITYSDAEIAFRNSPVYKRYEKLFLDGQKAEKAAMREAIRRLKNGTASVTEKNIVKEAEFTIWPTHKAYYGKELTVAPSNLPVITVDSTYYEIMEGQWGKNPIVERFRKRLRAAGYDYEPYMAGVYNIYKL